MFLGFQDPDPLVRGMYPDPTRALDPDPSNHQVRKILIPTVLWLLFYFLS